MALIDWIKENVKEGANLAEAEELYQKENPLQRIETVEEALSLIKENKTLLKALDHETSKRVDNALERFQENRLPEILKSKEEEIIKSLNPEETPEQKRIRELEEKVKSAEQKEAMQKRRQELREKAKAYAEEKGVKFDPSRAEVFASLGDDAENLVIDTIDYFGSYAKEVTDSALKSAYKGGAPKAGGGEPADFNQRIADLKKEGNLDKAASEYFTALRSGVLNGEK
jgi:nucleotide-binding universal stress UspA family protein